ncbi:hypothetical protein [Sinorhizobium arboris]|uniref:hypothetical protein n=1 Tax=Sinorhizobium arboris TaxID=76745 RepID=UPI00040C697F|nr:hypothetical protein [Sinorhizobium arboris]
MERIQPQAANTEVATEMWSVTEFCRRQNLCEEEKRRLTRLFGRFATARELLHNSKRAPRWRY